MNKKRLNHRASFSHKGIILVLSGGGARGLAHIGVLEVLEENKIPIKRIIGTSAGAMVGGLYSLGKLKQMKKFFLGLTRFDVFSVLFSLPSTRYIFNSKHVDETLKDFTKDFKIENLKIPFIAVAFDISNGKRVLFKTGKLFDAIRASISIPGIFKPMQIGESLFIDGGVTSVIPVDVAKKYAKNNKIVAINVESSKIEKLNRYNIFDVVNYASRFQTSELSKFQEKQANVIIKPKVSAGTFEFHKADEIIKEGRKAAIRALPEIRKAVGKK